MGERTQGASTGALGSGVRGAAAEHAFRNVEAHRIPDHSPSPDVYSGKWFKDADELKDFKRIGALLLIATK